MTPGRHDRTVALKAGIFGATLPVASQLLSAYVAPWLALGFTVAVWVGLFPWLPPRVHERVSPLLSLLCSLGAGLFAAGAIALLNPAAG